MESRDAPVTELNTFGLFLHLSRPIKAMTNASLYFTTSSAGICTVRELCAAILSMRYELNAPPPVMKSSPCLAPFALSIWEFI